METHDCISFHLFTFLNILPLIAKLILHILIVPIFSQRRRSSIPQKLCSSDWIGHQFYEHSLSGRRWIVFSFFMLLSRFFAIFCLLSRSNRIVGLVLNYILHSSRTHVVDPCGSYNPKVWDVLSVGI